MAAAIQIRKSLIDYYMECGSSANFIALAVILFLWLLYVSLLAQAHQRPSIHARLLLPCSLLPIMIGISGSSLASYEALTFYSSPSARYFDPTGNWQEILIPLIAGSFLSALGIFLSVVILFVHRPPLRDSERNHP